MDATVVEPPTASKDVASVTVPTTSVDNFKKDNKTVRGHLLNHMTKFSIQFVCCLDICKDNVDHIVIQIWWR